MQLSQVISALLFMIVTIYGQRDREVPPAASEDTGKDAVIRKYDFHLGENGDFNFA